MTKQCGQQGLEEHIWVCAQNLLRCFSPTGGSGTGGIWGLEDSKQDLCWEDLGLEAKFVSWCFGFLGCGDCIESPEGRRSGEVGQLGIASFSGIEVGNGENELECKVEKIICGNYSIFSFKSVFSSPRHQTMKTLSVARPR